MSGAAMGEAEDRGGSVVCGMDARWAVARRRETTYCGTLSSWQCGLTNDRARWLEN